ncbi:MAG TPA: tetratricopeptide repeat protein [Solimonas sp.]
MKARVLMLCLLLGGCASGGSSTDPGRVPAASSREVDVAVHADLIRGMLAQNNNYAALAHIQDQQRRTGNTAELRYLEAEARRRLGQIAEAEALYRGLLRSDLSAQAYHGLGLLYATGNLGQSIVYLREAAKRRPTDADVRSDLGFALLRAGQYDASLAELATAVELDAANTKARNNLLLLLMTTGDEAGVKRVAADTGIDNPTLTRLRKQAQSLRGAKAAGGVP